MKILTTVSLDLAQMVKGLTWAELNELIVLCQAEKDLLSGVAMTEEEEEILNYYGKIE